MPRQSTTQVLANKINEILKSMKDYDHCYPKSPGNSSVLRITSNTGHSGTAELWRYNNEALPLKKSAPNIHTPQPVFTPKLWLVLIALAHIVLALLLHVSKLFIKLDKLVFTFQRNFITSNLYAKQHQNIH